MYNIYKYQEEVKHQEDLRKQDQTYTKWLLRHQGIEMKAHAAEKIKQRTSHFVNEQSNNPSIVEDDHYKTWRYIKPHRDVEDSNKFIGFKAFRHRPHYDVGKYYSERQRKQIAHLAQKKHSLINSQIIPEEHRSRSLRSQGPLNPKHTFRDRKSDHEYKQPRMRYTNITDKERMMQTSITYADKLKQVYENFSLSKSKIGKTKVSPSKSSQKIPFDMIESTYSDVGRNQKYYYEAPNKEEESVQKNRSTYSKTGDSWNLKEKQSPRKKSYFKNAKTLALHGDNLAKAVMIETQYERKKDLTNLNKNLTNESFVKRPIL